MVRFLREQCLVAGSKMKENVQAVNKDVILIAMETSTKQYVVVNKTKNWALIQDVLMELGMRRELTHSTVMAILKNITLANGVIP